MSMILSYNLYDNIIEKSWKLIEERIQSSGPNRRKQSLNTYSVICLYFLDKYFIVARWGLTIWNICLWGNRLDTSEKKNVVLESLIKFEKVQFTRLKRRLLTNTYALHESLIAQYGTGIMGR